METCPPEIHSYICELACLADPRTSRALSTVSRYFRDIAGPFLYQSIAVTGGPSELSILTSKLEELPSRSASIRHIFFADQQPKGDLIVNTSTQSRPSSPSSSIMAALMRLITLAAPTLNTLSVVITNHAHGTPIFARLFHTHFPHLRELSLSGFYPYPSSSIPSTSLLPALTHLHLHGNRNPHGLLHLDALSDTICPSLMHLRISGLSMAVSFASELRTALSGEAAEDQLDSLPASVLSPVFQPKLPTRVRHLYIQPGPEQRLKVGAAAGAETVAHLKERIMMGHLEFIQASAAAIESRSGVKVYLLPRTDMAGVHDAFKENWEERLRGEEGCWATPL